MKEIKNTLPKTLVLKYSLAQGQCLNFLNMCTKPILSWFFGGIVSPKSSLVFTHRLAHQSYANKRVNHQATWSALSFCFGVSSLSDGKGFGCELFSTSHFSFCITEGPDFRMEGDVSHT